MRRLISMFYEPDDDYAPSQAGERPPQKHRAEAPLYYLALMSYLQEQQDAEAPLEEDERAELVGAGRD